MQEYTIGNWILFFYIYSIMGWCIESTIVPVSRRKIINRGFLTGPFLPIYGFGALSILVMTVPVRDNFYLVYFFGMIAATVLEYVAGTIMELLFHVKYWDYSYRKIQFQGKVCLVSSLFWGALALILTEVIHSPIEEIVLGLPKKTSDLIIIIIGITLCVDLYYATKAAFDLKHTLEKLSIVKVEIDKLQQQLNKAKESAEGQLNKLKAATNKTMDETINFKEKLRRLQSEKESITTKFNGLKKRILRSYPHVDSKWFHDSLKELKDKFKKKKKDK